MNSSWNGSAETNVYQRGDLLYLQASVSGVPGRELYIQSCYATPSLDPADESRYTLILNKGCVSSKQSVVKFVSRQNCSINLILHTSTLKFSQVYVHCSMVLSHYGLSPSTKSCNYNKNASRWVELGGQTAVCDCCASRCRGLPHYRGLLGEFMVLVSTVPVTIVEQPSSIGASQFGASAIDAGKGWTVSGAAQSSTERGWVASETSGAGSSVRNKLNSSPWWSQPAVTNEVMVINQDLGDALSLWLPGLMVDIQSNPVFKMEIDSQKVKGHIPSLSSPLTEELLLDDYGAEGQKEEPLKISSELKSPNQELPGVADWLAADAPDLRSEELDSSDTNYASDFWENQEEGEELRGDVFGNFSPHSPVDESAEDVPPLHADGPISQLHNALKNKIRGKTESEDEVVVLSRTEMLFKRVKDVQLEPLKQSKLTLTQDPDGSSSLRYEEQQRTPYMADQEVRKTWLDLGRKGVGEGRRTQLGTGGELMVSLLDLLRGLNKAVTSMHSV
ncbi:zona pellucida protein C [Electrophorus electricus]|uniref:zona pellucida protein C n=1 Tax=Electrophorus electricus TaxID=8005 RepID=UPI0015D099F8|nr:zona pellucida protein C [Electrophorus electricus]